MSINWRRLRRDPILIAALKSSMLAWVWLLVAFLHIVLSALRQVSLAVNIEDPALTAWDIFDRLVFFSSAVLFATAGALKQLDPNTSLSKAPFFPFFIQFLFWWGIGYLIYKVSWLWQNRFKG